MNNNKDWEGKDVSQNEKSDAEILIWEISPHLQASGKYDVAWIRGWQEMLKFLEGNLEFYLEKFTKEEMLEEGVTIKIKLIKMKKDHFEEETFD